MPSTAVLLFQRIKPFFPPFPTGLSRSSPILSPVLAPLPSVEVSTTKSTPCRRNEQAQNQRAHSTLEPQNARAPKPTLWHAKTHATLESTKVASISNAKEILDSYNPSIQRDHIDIVKPALYAFLEFLPEDGRHELITDINKTGGNEETLYGVFDNLYTALRSLSKWEFSTHSQKPPLMGLPSAISLKTTIGYLPDLKARTVRSTLDFHAYTHHTTRGFQKVPCQARWLSVRRYRTLWRASIWWIRTWRPRPQSCWNWRSTYNSIFLR